MAKDRSDVGVPLRMQRLDTRCNVISRKSWEGLGFLGRKVLNDKTVSGELGVGKARHYGTC